jgi:membrane associated rhomboid family serine protease
MPAGSALYVALLVIVAMTVVRGWWRLDTFAIGTLDAAAVQSGQWWRAITALTLHVDIVHLLMNLGAGTAIGYLASRQIGVGHAWLLTVLGAGVANLVRRCSRCRVTSRWASTAVFAALGLLAAHSWRMRLIASHLTLRRWAPLIARNVAGLDGHRRRGDGHIAHLFARGRRRSPVWSWLAPCRDSIECAAAMVVRALTLALVAGA